MKQASKDVHFDRELVIRSFKTQLAVLKLPPRPVIFHPNLRAAAERLVSGARARVAVTVRDLESVMAAWVAADVVTGEAGWQTVRGDASVDRTADLAWEAAWASGKHIESDAAWETAMEGAWGAENEAWRAERATETGTSWAVWHSKGDAVRVAVLGAAAAVTEREAYGYAWVARPSDSPFVVASRTFREIMRGGAFFFWIAPDVVHVVLAIRTQEPPRLPASFRGPERTVSRLHREDGPAIEYEDGSGFYFWKGIRVPDHLILRPDLLRVDMILSEANVEMRRVMIERYGLDRFVLDAHAKTLDKWKDNELLSIELPEDPDRCLIALKLRCPSTAAVYIIRVPPDQRTVQGALAWSFGLANPEHYVLRQES